jgi:integrase
MRGEAGGKPRQSLGEPMGRTRRAGQVVARGERKWLLRIFLGTDASGRRQYWSKTFHGTKKAAQEELNKRLTENDRGIKLGGGRQTIEQYLVSWLDQCVRVSKRERTYLDYKYTVEHYILPELGPVRLSGLTVQHVKDFYAGLSERLKPPTCRRIHATLRAGLAEAVRDRLVPDNVAALARNALPKSEPKQASDEDAIRRVLTAAEARRFLECAEQVEDGAAYTLMLHTGARPSEILALKWDDVDLDGGRLHIRRTLSDHKGLRFAPPKTKKSRRTITLSPAAVETLRRQKVRQVGQRLKAGDAWGKARLPGEGGDTREAEFTGLVFTTAIGTPHSQASLRSRKFLQIRRAAGIGPDEQGQELTPYGLRHTHATLLLEAGEPLEKVSKRLGHATITLTADTYHHYLPAAQESAVEKLVAVFG